MDIWSINLYIDRKYQQIVYKCLMEITQGILVPIATLRGAHEKIKGIVSIKTRHIFEEQKRI